MARKSNPILDILQTVPTIEDTNSTKAKLPADKDIVIIMLFRVWAYAGFARGGANFWGSGRVACREASCGVATRLLGGFGCMLPRAFFLNGTIWYILEHIFINVYLKRVQFIMQNIPFLYKKA